MNKLLLLEDDSGLIDGLSYSLKKKGYELLIVTTVREAKQYVDAGQEMDLMILDVSLPDGTGFEVCEYVRTKGLEMPIIFLTAAEEEYNVIRGLDCGGDDYLTKPFKLGELCSRIHALLRRSHRVISSKDSETALDELSIQSGDIRIDLLGSRVYYKEHALELWRCHYCGYIACPKRTDTGHGELLCAI